MPVILQNGMVFNHSFNETHEYVYKKEINKDAPNGNVFTYQEEKMQLKMFSIRDSKGEVFHPPFFNHSHGEAERNFAQAVRDDKSTLNKFPEDFDLYYLGTYDNLTGKMASLDSPQHLVKAVNFINK